MKKIWLVWIFLWSIPNLQGQDLERYEYDHFQMGTRFGLIVYSSDPALADSAARVSFRHIDQLNEIFSDYLAQSELSRLSSSAGSGQWVKVSPDLWSIIKFSLTISELTNGSFDITIGPVSHLWRQAFQSQEFPPTRQIEEAVARVGYSKLELNEVEQEVALKSGTVLDLGGVAKGWAAQDVVQILNYLGLPRVMVDAGGDIAVGQSPPGEKGWKIAFQKFDAQKRLVLDSTRISNRAIATSGDQYKYLDWEGKRYSHLADPRTGIGVTHRRLVTVIGPHGGTCDALASAFSILGPNEMKKVKRRFPEYRIIVSEAAPGPR